ncbi:energy transducer TonB [Acidicapsa dinghuensis]|uniref:Energy transducer TonB n=1 Tax=Acidicapsa dinghuensis TaxID=2218256 RepID=A0ABW1EAM9_9BACT|nr:energy transducer TonB [Acidicapsa dinghuensis]
MPTGVALAEPEPTESDRSEAEAAGRGNSRDKDGYSSSRWVDYDTHELLEKISQYEDERRWQRIREGIWISIILHFLLFLGIAYIPRYVFHQVQLIDPIQAIRNRKDLTYLDELPDAIKQAQKLKPKPPALKPNEAMVDKKTLDALKAMEKAQPKPKEPAPEVKQQQSAPLPQPQPQPQQQAAVTPPPPMPQPSQQITPEAPRPAPVPAKPNFSLGSQNPADQLRQAMRDSMRPGDSGQLSGPSLNQHSGADGGVQVLSDTQGVDFNPYLQKVIRETYRTWDPLIPEEVNPPILKRGQCEIVFTILPNGRVQAHSMTLTGRSGDVALDRAAWGSIEGADYPPLPREFHGPYLQLRFRFQYNIH